MRDVVVTAVDVGMAAVDMAVVGDVDMVEAMDMDITGVVMVAGGPDGHGPVVTLVATALVKSACSIRVVELFRFSVAMVTMRAVKHWLSANLTHVIGRPA